MFRYNVSTSVNKKFVTIHVFLLELRTEFRRNKLLMPALFFELRLFKGTPTRYDMSGTIRILAYAIEWARVNKSHFKWRLPVSSIYIWSENLVAESKAKDGGNWRPVPVLSIVFWPRGQHKLTFSASPFLLFFVFWRRFKDEYCGFMNW